MKHFFLFIALSFLALPLAALAQAGWTIDQYDATIAVQDDGSVLIEERILVDFGSLNKHGIYRDLPVVYQRDDNGRHYSELSDITVEQDGVPAEVQVTRNDANLRIRIGDPDVTISGQHAYAVSYRVLGVLQSFDDYDELYWNVTGDDWEAPIAQATALVRVPAVVLQQACFAGRLRSVDDCDEMQDTADGVSFVTRHLAPGEGMTVAVGFTPDVVPIVVVDPPPSLADILLAPVTLGITLTLFLLGAGLMFRTWRRYGRDRWWRRAHLPGVRSDRDGMEVSESILPLGYRQSVSVEYEPPDDLRPAEIGVLLDERADTLDVSATIVDLASRGYLTITEVEKKWLFGKKDYELSRTQKAPNDVREFERVLLTRLFDDGLTVRLSSLKNSFYKDLAKVKELLYQEVVAKKLFAGRPDRVRLKYLGLGIAGEVLGMSLVVVSIVALQALGGLSWYQPILAGLGIGLMATAAVVLGFAAFMPRKTGYGRELYQRALGYQLFVSGTEKYRAKFYEDESLFVAVLPYAIMFGVTDQLAKAFAAMGVKPPQPAWYHGAAAFDAQAFSTSMAAFSKSLSTAIASRPGSSGSGGGGFSGGGFGGGGGGSW